MRNPVLSGEGAVLADTEDRAHTADGGWPLVPGPSKPAPQLLHLSIKIKRCRTRLAATAIAAAARCLDCFYSHFETMPWIWSRF